MRHGGKYNNDIGLFLNSTCDIGEMSDRDTGHCHYFLKIDMRHWGLPIKGPKMGHWWGKEVGVNKVRGLSIPSLTG